MSITYPLTTPTSIGIAEVTFTARSVTARSSSPFTLKQQVLKWPGQRWEASISIPPCRRDVAEEWVAFLLSLKGSFGTFLLKDPNYSASQGLASSQGDTILVNGASQTGDTLAIDGLSTGLTDYFKAGDYISLGSGTSTQLYKVLTDTDSDVSGEATLDLWPDLRTSPSDNASVEVVNPRGLFRLKSPDVSWSINDISSYGISFEAVEAL